MKKAFTFVELLVVVVLILILYGVFFSNANFEFKSKKEEPLSLNNLKGYLLKNYSFKHQLEVVCLKFENSCYVFIDEVKNKQIVLEDFLPKSFNVYSYEKEPKRLDFKTLEFENLESYDASFRYKIDDNKSDTMIIETNNEVILMHSIQTPTILENMSQVNDYFEQKVTEVKDAF